MGHARRCGELQFVLLRSGRGVFPRLTTSECRGSKRSSAPRNTRRGLLPARPTPRHDATTRYQKMRLPIVAVAIQSLLVLVDAAWQGSSTLRQSSGNPLSGSQWVAGGTVLRSTPFRAPSVAGKVAGKAVLSVSAVGCYSLLVNGQRPDQIHHGYLAPGFSTVPSLRMLYEDIGACSKVV